MTTEPARKAKRVLGIIPIALGLLIVLTAAVFAWSHMAARGTAPQKDVTSQEILEGDVEPAQEPYRMDDFTEPARK